MDRVPKVQDKARTVGAALAGLRSFAVDLLEAMQPLVEIKRHFLTPVQARQHLRRMLRLAPLLLVWFALTGLVYLGLSLACQPELLALSVVFLMLLNRRLKTKFLPNVSSKRLGQRLGWALGSLWYRLPL